MTRPRFLNRGPYISGYWENGNWKANLAEDGVTPASAMTNFALSVSGGNVYAAGALGESAAYWRNGMLVKLPSGYPTWGSTEGHASSIQVVGSNIYAAGWVEYYDGPVS
jgi:hypothetical protein